MLNRRKHRYYVPAKHRSPLRIFIGRIVYTFLRYVLWIRFAGRFVSSPRKRRKGTVNFGFLCTEHKTPLFRHLSGSDKELERNKVHNLSLAVRRLDGVVIEPGEVFSYWRLIGPPSHRRGFRKGMVLVNGHPMAHIGGGLCQLSNLIYWMTIHTPLTVIERFRHSYDVFPDSNRTQPFGSGATCVYNYRDLQIRNDDAVAYRLRLWLDDEFLHGSWSAPCPIDLRYEVYEQKHWISQEAAGVYLRHNILRRRVLRDGQEIDDQYVAENHALMMYAPLLDSLRRDAE
ncbi:VanW family protein [Sediminispirochaeta smaragdinae]|uniref:VanW family protein n=1 Tax=Sediminispirochaeta smaragdinae (strain DSM 11293 / JCM 15392 / SEBR 4228) TaxID=573413 RepID=E1R8X9_SEDSS|nr:VanW family protein [Sediminispirochaeta smaragdinae]ADK82948.1 VanW family protein [Sediminispirochaeta smaragdinae DSM 11293]